MASTNIVDANEKIARFKAYGIGIRHKNDNLYENNNAKIFKAFTRLGVYRFDDESLFHKSNYIHCNIPKCNKVFDTVFAYESHYNAAHRFKCSQCSKSLPNAHFLDLHLSERHDSFFAVQAERKPMYRCYLEECTHLSKDANERRDHCIKQHKFPHDFRFDIKSGRGKKGREPGKSSSVSMECDDSNSDNPVLPPTKLIQPDVVDEDVQLENKSIILSAQRKPNVTNFSFGHTKAKSFNTYCDHNYAKSLSAKGKNPKNSKAKSADLDDDRVFDDLMESLPS